MFSFLVYTLCCWDWLLSGWCGLMVLLYYLILFVLKLVDYCLIVAQYVVGV